MKKHKIIDAWMQHPTPRFANQEMFASLRKWLKVDKIEGDIPLEMTVAAMDIANISKGLICSWEGPQGDLISNKEVAGFIEKYPDRFVGIASVKLNKPVHELRKCVREYGFKGLSERSEINYSKMGLRDFLIIEAKNAAIAGLW